MIVQQHIDSFRFNWLFSGTKIVILSTKKTLFFDHISNKKKELAPQHIQ